MMSYTTAAAQDQKRAEAIRRQYISREDNKIEQLRKLDSKVKAPGRILAGVMGVAGTLVMGAGMSLVMVWSNMVLGLALGIPGLAVALLAYPLYTLVTNGRKKKYTAEIMRLSGDLMDR